MDPISIQLKNLIQQLNYLQEEIEIADEIIDSLLEDTDTLLEDTLDEEKKNWIQGAIKKPGALRKSLKAKQGKNIPVSKLEKAAEKGGKLGQRARLALKLRKFKKKKG